MIFINTADTPFEPFVSSDFADIAAFAAAFSLPPPAPRYHLRLPICRYDTFSMIFFFRHFIFAG